MTRWGWRCAVFWASVAWAALLSAAPRVAIIIDDLGNDLEAGRRVARLPAAVTCSFLPATPYGAMLARLAHALDKEVMLHLPMDSIDDRPLGRHGLTVGMTRKQFMASLRHDLDAIPHVIGVNNHMGSLLTQLPENMVWLMAELRRRGLYFIDSRTTRATVAQDTARSFGIVSGRRDVFLDNVPTVEAVDRQFDKLLAMARRRGRAIAIGHPYPATVEVLERRLRRPEVEVVPVSALLTDGAGSWTPDLVASSQGTSALPSIE